MYVLEDKLELGCTPGLEYPLCVSAESTARGFGDFIGWLAQIVLGSQKFAPGTTLWDSAIGEASNWFAIAIVVMLCTGIIGVSTGMLSMKGRRLWISLAGIAAAIPSTFLSLMLGGELLKISDQLSDLALTRIGGADGFENLFRAAVQNGTGSDLFGAVSTAAGLSSAPGLLFMLIMILAGLVVMSFALAFRNLGLMVLIAFSPLAFMAVPMRGGWGIAKKWAMAGIALLLSKPLMFGILAMLLKSSEGMALFSSQTLTVVTGLFVVSFMPMMAYSFFAFLGSNNENMAGQGMAGQAGQKASAPMQRIGGMVTGKIGAGAAGFAGSIFGKSKGSGSTGPRVPTPPQDSKGKPDDAGNKKDQSSGKGGGKGSSGQNGGGQGAGKGGGQNGGKGGSGGGRPGGNRGGGVGSNPEIRQPPSPTPQPDGGQRPQSKFRRPSIPKW
ncbi:hypothetical protein [Leucobacter chromiiresistens]|uniref:TrbL/VirB6 plasmid conjugal transfer protein n=1 Tax=Leucobacter chromiiresistens TaxID=1079994 RepID=A0A1H1A051_9MICO|nr:hypothetical protein [Leucobacter chromiiresistens]SDQ32676.1 hypothetical protein SAMN04488565_2194 [Leucobacter chromiiresistens]